MKSALGIGIAGILFLMTAVHSPAQKKSRTGGKTAEGEPLFEGFIDRERDTSGIRIVFYNLENLYDPHNDSLTNDEEFTPEGAKHWNYKRYILKLQYLSRTLLATGGWEPPEIIGVCEVENRNVLLKLTDDTPLAAFGYRIIHHESADPRGVDVALLYRPDKIKPLTESAIPVRFAPDTISRTRDILYIKLLVLEKDTLHVFVNHWPSRFGGYMQTVAKRAQAASILKRQTDSILKSNPLANIVIMGDLNDDPQDESISRILIAGGGRQDAGSGQQEAGLVNLMPWSTVRGYAGTLKHGETWHTFDQFIVSVSLHKGLSHLGLAPEQSLIFHAPFLLTDDPGRFGEKLNRTYLGPRYLGGFSDHLPIYLDILVK
jgi:hypothetical protein